MNVQRLWNRNSLPRTGAFVFCHVQNLLFVAISKTGCEDPFEIFGSDFWRVLKSAFLNVGLAKGLLYYVYNQF